MTEGQRDRDKGQEQTDKASGTGAGTVTGTEDVILVGSEAENAIKNIT